MKLWTRATSVLLTLVMLLTLLPVSAMAAGEPAITAQPKSVTAAEDSKAVFRVTATGAETYQWQYRASAAGSWKSATAAGNKTAQLTVPVTESRDGYQYRCKIKTTDGKILYSKAATLTVGSGMAITGQPADQDVYAGEKAVFAVETTGKNLAYQWQYRTSAAGSWKSATATGNKTKEMLVPATTGRDGYQYRCKVQDINGKTLYSKAAELAVSSAFAITSQPTDQTVYEGETAVFTVEVSGRNLTYQWQYRTSSGGSWKSATATGNKTAKLSVPATLSRDGYQYRCRIKDSSGTTLYSKAATLTVYPEPEITVPPADQLAYAGKTVVFAVEAVGEGLTYQWQYRTSATGTWATATATGNKTARLSVPATVSRDGYQYRCRVKDVLGTTLYTRSAKLVVCPELTIAAEPENQSVYAGETAKFAVTASGYGLVYQWQYRASAGQAWAASAESGSGTAVLSVPAVKEHDGYQYRCVITDALGETVYTKAAALHIRAKLEILTQPEDQTVKQGEKAVFAVEAAGDGLTYQWQYRAGEDAAWQDAAGGEAMTQLAVGALVEQDGYQFRCLVTDAYGTTLESCAATLTVLYPPEILAEPEDQIAVEDQTVTFAVEAGGKNLTYEWQYRTATKSAWMRMEEADGEELTVTAVREQDGWQYRCKISDGVHETLYSDIAVLTVFGKPEIVSQPTDRILPEGSEAEFSVRAIGYELTYQWEYRISDESSWKNATAAGNKTATMTVPVTASRDEYQYRCCITDAAGNEVYSNEVLLMVGELQYIYVDEFSAYSTSVYAYAYFTDGTESEIKISHVNGVAVTYHNLDGAKLNGYSCGWFAYIQKDDKYRLVYVEEQTGDQSVEDGIYIVNYKYGTDIDLDETWYRGNSETVFVVLENDGDTKTFIGIENAPRILSGDDTDVNVVYSGRYAKCVFIRLGSGHMTIVSNDTIFLLKCNAVGNDADEDVYYRFAALVNGEQRTIRIGKAFLDETIGEVTGDSRAMLVDVQYASKTYVEKATFICGEGETGHENITARKVRGTQVTLRGQTLTFDMQNENDYFMADDYAIFVIEPNGEYETYTMKQLTRAAGNGTIDIVGANIYGVMNRDAEYTALYIALDPPVETRIIAQPEDQTRYEDEYAEFSVIVEGKGLTYQWQYCAGDGEWTDSPIAGNKTAALSVLAKLSRDGYQYRCMVTDSSGETVYSDPATLISRPLVEITAHPKEPIAYYTDDAVFSVTAEGKYGGLEYQWQGRSGWNDRWEDITSHPGSRTATLTIPADQVPWFCGECRCVVTDVNGYAVYSDATTVRVRELEDIYITKFFAVEEDVKAHAYFTDGTSSVLTVDRLDNEIVTTTALEDNTLFGYASGWFKCKYYEDVEEYHLVYAQNLQHPYGDGGVMVYTQSGDKAVGKGTEIFCRSDYIWELSGIFDGSEFYAASDMKIIVVDMNGGATVYDVRFYDDDTGIDFIIGGDSTTINVLRESMWENTLTAFVDLRDGVVLDGDEVLFLRQATYRKGWDGHVYDGFFLVDGVEMRCWMSDRALAGDMDSDEYYEYQKAGDFRAILTGDDQYWYCDGCFENCVSPDTVIRSAGDTGKDNITAVEVKGNYAVVDGQTLELGTQTANDYYMADNYVICVVEPDGEYESYTMRQLTGAVNNGTVDIDGSIVYGVMNKDNEYTTLYIALK